MKLFLASLASATLDLVLPLLPDQPKNLKVAFIPTAADPYGKIEMPWMEADRNKLTEMGFSVFDYDLKDKTVESLRKDLVNFQVIFVAGGNTFYLLNEVNKSGFDVVIKELLDNGVVYIGASAGSMLMGPDLNHLLTVDHPEIVPELTDYTCLKLVKERILPHLGREKYADRHAKLLAQWGNKLLPLSDNQALVVNGDKIEVVTSPGEV
jgi:dipeptidase E